MKIFLFLVLLSCISLPQQFNGLRGMEDSSGNTHLFYRIFTEPDSSGDNSIYHFDLNFNIDTLFLRENNSPSAAVFINDFEFRSNNPANYIYSQTEITTDTLTKIITYNGDVLFTQAGKGGNIELSRQNVNLIYADVNNVTYKTTDGGQTWNAVPFGRISSVSPFDDDIIFSVRDDSLYKSYDGGNYFYLSQLNANNDLENNFLYDKNGIHIYRKAEQIDEYNHQYYLYISDYEGEPFSWNTLFQTGSPFYISVDTSVSGAVYFTEGYEILFSFNYGNIVTEFNTLPRSITGIYAKPGSGKVYASTVNNLYEVTFGGKEVIKHLDLSNSTFSYYPLRPGLKWVYRDSYVIFDFGYEEYSYDYSIEVMGDTLLDDGFIYFILKETRFEHSSFCYERIDSSNGIVKRYEMGDVYFLSMLPEEIVLSPYGYITYSGPGIINKFGVNRPAKFYEYLESLYYQKYFLIKDFGIDSLTYSFDKKLVPGNPGKKSFGYGVITLKGIVKDGVVYGDTTILAVDDNIQKPVSFALYQNYPNPFNPITIIKYELPHTAFITIKVFDILGNLVSVLVNEEKDSGVHDVTFNGMNLSSGVYFYNIRSEGINQTRKMILMR